MYSIGHGQKPIEEFIDELKSFKIKYLIDVRTNPYSKWAPHFNQGVLNNLLKIHGIVYGYMGDSLGGKPQIDNCYDEEGYFDYRKMAEIPSFRSAICRLLEANRKGLFVAIMCTETDPLQCHRSKLIGRELYFGYGINMSHIIGEYRIITQTQVMTELTKGAWIPEGNLFGECDPPYFKSRRSYKNLILEEELIYD